jgi:hypothetical protein
MATWLNHYIKEVKTLKIQAIYSRAMAAFLIELTAY